MKRLFRRVAPLTEASAGHIMRNVNIEFDSLIRTLQDVEGGGTWVPPGGGPYNWSNLFKQGTHISAREAFGDWISGYESLTTHIWKFVDPHSSHPEWTVGVMTPLIDSRASIWLKPYPTGVVRIETYNLTGQSSNTGGTTWPAVADGGDGSVAWQNPDYADRSDDNSATVSFGLNPSTTNYLKAEGFGFVIPDGSTILGIIVNIERQAGNATVKDTVVQLLKNGIGYGENKADLTTAWPSAPDQTKTYGSATDDWLPAGETWTSDDINDANFGVQVKAQRTAGTENCGVDSIGIIVYYTAQTGDTQLIVRGVPNQIDNMVEVQNWREWPFVVVTKDGYLGLLENDAGANPTKYTYLKCGDQAAHITYTLPTAQAVASGYYLSNDGSGNLSWSPGPSPSAAPIDASYVTLATNATLTAERVLTGTANQITLTDNGAGNTIVLSLPQNIHTGGSPQFTNLTLTGYYEGAEISTPTTPAANYGRFYVKDDGSGESALFFLSDAGVETQVTGGGTGGATNLPALTDVDDALAYTVGFVLRADGSAYTGQQLAHADLSGIGTNSHAVIDSHIDTDVTVHASATNLVKTTGDQTIAGVKTFSSFPVTPSASPTANYQVANKSYVDAVAVGLTWKEPVIDKDLSDPPGAPASGDRYIVKTTGINGWAGHDEDIAEWNGASWDFSDPLVGWAVITTDDSKGWTWDGSAWIQFTASEVYTASLGVEKVGNDFRADLLAAGAVGLTGNELKVNVDGSSIEIATNALQVKALGITNAMLAGSIADSKLLTISTASKVDWAAVNKTGSILDDIADVNVGGASNGQALTWDAGSSTWVPASVSGGGGGAQRAMLDVDLLAGTGEVTWTNMPAATTELLGSTLYRVKFDLTYATHFRLQVQQSVAGFSTADLNLQYSTDGTTFVAADTGAAGELAVGAGTGLKVGAWAELAAGAKQDVWLRIVGKQGNGTADPRFRQLRIQFKMLALVTTDDLPEGASNLYYTDERAQDAIGNNLGTGLAYNDAAGAISLSHLGIQSLVDPNADRLLGWDDTDGATKFLTIGTGLSYDHGTYTLSATSGAPTDAPYLTNGAVAGLSAEVNVQALAAALTFQNNDAAIVPVIVKGFTSQTADIFQVQNSAGTILAKITSAGYLGIGIGTATPVDGFEMQGFNMYIGKAVGSASAAAYQGRKSRGTYASPSAVLSGDGLTGFYGWGYKATGWSGAQAGMRFNTTQDWTDTACGSQIVFSTTPNNSTTAANVVTIDQDGSLNLVGIVKTYNNVATDGYGVPAIVDETEVVARATAIGSTNLANTAVSGAYRVCYYLWCSTAGSGTNTVYLTVAYNDGAAQTVNSATITMGSTVQHTSGTLPIMNTSGSISYSTTIAGAWASDRYRLLIWAERVN